MLCGPFKRGEGCPNGSKCFYAHGPSELRPLPPGHRGAGAAGLPGGSATGFQNQKNPSNPVDAAHAAAPITEPQSTAEAQRLISRAMDDSNPRAMRLGLEFLARESKMVCALCKLVTRRHLVQLL